MKKPKKLSPSIAEALKILAEIRSDNAAALYNLKAADKLLGAVVKHDPSKKHP